jgi:CRP-like cAMP-binding protein
MTPFTKSFKTGMHLFRENDRSRELYLIQSGKVKVYRSAGGREIELAVLEKGAVLGEMALIDGKPRSASAKAVEDAAVVIIDAETFHERIKGVPPWFMSIVKMTSQKIRQANRRLQNFSHEHQSAHVIIALCFYMQRFAPGSSGIDIRSTQHHLIQLLGVTSPIVIYALDFLQKNDFIDISDCLVRVIDQNRLLEYSEYLRVFIRNQYKDAEEPSSALSALADELVNRYPAIVRGTADATEIPGELFHQYLQMNDLHQGYPDFIEQMVNSGLCNTLRKNREAAAAQPLGDVMIKIHHAGWKRIYLYNKFNKLNPGHLP